MDKLDHAFDVLASYFGVLSEPTRLRIMHAICEEEKTVSQIVAELGATQTNISRHLNMMHRSGVLARRKAGNQVHYRAADAAMVEICRSVCSRIATQLDQKKPLRGDLLRLMPRAKSKKRAA
ncbi:MAG: ArsR family transcriptional regulator [Betaproteobacteria bacterium]|nr:MAG: ArsR family transcriptional regulator [Betaproteobacteria bacterium]